jgi:hypothetical protein
MSQPIISYLHNRVLKESNLNLDIAIYGDQRDPAERVYPTAAVFALRHLLNLDALDTILLADNGWIQDHTSSDPLLKGRGEMERINAFLHEALLPLWVNYRHPDFGVGDGIQRKIVDLSDVRNALVQYGRVPQPTLAAVGFARLSTGDIRCPPEEVLRELVDTALGTLSCEVKMDLGKRIRARTYYAILTAPRPFFSIFLKSDELALRKMAVYLSQKLSSPLTKVLGEVGLLKFDGSNNHSNNHVRLTVLISGIDPNLVHQAAKNCDLEENPDGPPIVEIIRSLSQEQVQDLAQIY